MPKNLPKNRVEMWLMISSFKLITMKYFKIRKIYFLNRFEDLEDLLV